MAPLLRPPPSISSSRSSSGITTTTTTTRRLSQHIHQQARLPQSQSQARRASLLLSSSFSQRPLHSSAQSSHPPQQALRQIHRNQPQIKALHTSALRPSSAHESPYDPPTGDLWGVPPGQTYQKEGWEGLWIYGFFGSLAFGVVGYAFKADTSIETWALEEAKRRLQAEGILPEEEGQDQAGEQAR